MLATYQAKLVNNQLEWIDTPPNFSGETYVLITVIPKSLMQPKTQKLFSYGTLQLERVQLATFGRLLNGEQDALIGYQLGEIEIKDADVIAKSGKTHHPMLIKTDDINDKVDGVIFDITDDELAHADEYEVDDYARVEGKFASGATAWIYADARDLNQSNAK